MPKDPITLFNFRYELDESVLERGWYYFNNAWVKNSKEVMPAHFEAIVEEVNPQAVSFSLTSQGEFSNIFCTCGDQKHKICRHMAAVIFVYEKQFIEQHRPTDWERIEEDSLQPFSKIKKDKK